MQAKSRNIPAADYAIQRKQRCACIDYGGAAIGGAKGKRHGLFRGEKSSAIFIKGLRHLQLAAGELLVTQLRAFSSTTTRAPLWHKGDSSWATVPPPAPEPTMTTS